MSPYNSRWDKQDDQHLDRQVDRWVIIGALVIIAAAVLCFFAAIWSLQIAQGG